MSDDALRSPSRLDALRTSRLLDSPRDGDFDQLTRLAATLLRVPNALVTLVADDRQYVKSTSADEPGSPHGTGSSQPLEMSFCKYTVASGEPFVVEDAREHPLVRDNVAVANGVRAYAGIPLEAAGQPIGALCVIDTKPRRWTSDELDTLRALARSASKLVDERVEAQSTAEWHGEEPTKLLACIAAHLRHLVDYETVIGHRPLDLAGETRARDDVLRGLAQLRRSLEEDQGLGDGELRDTTATYLEAERRRAAASERFAAGEIRLAELEAMIAEQGDALAALRVAALDRGVEP